MVPSQRITFRLNMTLGLIFPLLVTLIYIFPLTHCQKTFLDNEFTIQLLRSAKEFFSQLIGNSRSRDSRLLKSARAHHRLQYEIPETIPFPCNTTGSRSKAIPKSVNQLKPGDIDVIGAMGDSLTAGFGIFATEITDILIENRGTSALGGGQGNWRRILTLPNILKEFNPGLIGFATEDSWSHQPASQFNVAESASMSRDMPYMALNLVNRMKTDPRVNINKHWKLISIFIGSNDFCSDMCWIPSAWSTLSNHKNDMIKTLRILKHNLPRTIISLVPPPHMKVLVEMEGRSKLCSITSDLECSCLLGLTWRRQRSQFYEIMKRWQMLDEEIANYPEFNTREFAVVMQTFSTSLNFPKLPDGMTDFRYLSADCFHMSQLGNARIAFSVWRNLLEPVGKKTRSWDELNSDLTNFPCPTKERPYIATLGNS